MVNNFTDYLCSMRQSIEISCPAPALNRLTTEFTQVAFVKSNSSAQRSVLALGEISGFTHVYSQQPDQTGLKRLEAYLEQTSDWVFGYLSYDLKIETSPRQSSMNIDRMEFPLIRFFQPEWVVEWRNGSTLLHFHGDKSSADDVNRMVSLLAAPDRQEDEKTSAEFKPVVSRSEYIEVVTSLQRHIQLGNIYEVNYCMPFETEATGLNCAALYNRLNSLTEAPFSAYYSDDDHALMCGSPERFLKKSGNHLVAQPIKGTIRRGAAEEDATLINQLKNDPKERAENVMITDLVRNDLSRVAAPQSVKVDELCGVYSFKTVHQMISTISATLAEGKTFADIIVATFPMGSMTGAPKVRAMQLIEEAEVRQRGLYSGSFGYFEPNGDFDFNVVIRSLMYNKNNQCLSFQVGSAITALSDPEKEYEECLLKADALLRSTQIIPHAV